MVTVCQICGDRGFEEALIQCDSCKIEAIHCYCLGITPVPFEEYIIWFCEECDGSDCGSDNEEVDMTTKLRDIFNKSEKKKKKKKKKKSKESSSHTSQVLAAEDNGIQDTNIVESGEVSSSPTIIEIVKESERRESSENGNSDELTGLVGHETSASEKCEKEKKKKKRKRIINSLPVLPVEDHLLPDATSVDPVEVSTKRQSSDELNGLVRGKASVVETGDGASVSEKEEKEKKKKKKMKKRKSINESFPVLPAEDHELPDASNIEPVEVSKKQQSSVELNSLVSNEATVLEVGHGASASEKCEKEKKKKKRKSINHYLPVCLMEDPGLSEVTDVEPVEVSKKRIRSDELNSLVTNEAPVLKAGDVASVSEKGDKEKKKKKKRKSINHFLQDLPAEDHELPEVTDVESVEVSKKQQISDELNSLVRNEATVLEVGDVASISEKGDKEKKKKKKRKSSDHSLPVLPVEDHELPNPTNVEPMEAYKKRQSSDELNGLVRNEATGLEKCEKERKKKKKRKSINDSFPVLPVEDHELPNATIVEPAEASKKRQSSEELNDLVRNEVSVLEKIENKKKKKKTNKEVKKKNEESSNHTLPDLAVEEDHLLPDATIVEPVEVSKKRHSSEELNGLVRNKASVLEKIEKKKKKKRNEERSNNTLPDLAVEEDHLLQATNKETTYDSERQETDKGKSHELSGLVKGAASSVSEAGNSSTEPDYTSKKRKLSSGNIRITSANTQLDAEENTCKEAESNMPQTSEKLTAMDCNSPLLLNDRAQPIREPVWRGTISIKNRNIGSIDGLVAHLSSLACYQVHEKSSSLHVRLSAEMFPRLEIWPKSFLKNGGPIDDSIALYFFPSSDSDSNHEAVFYSLVCEMKKNDLAMKCVLDDAELILFTSYQLPMHCWTFHSKEYLWGAFKPRKTSRH